MGSTENLTYENFIRFAFEKATGRSIERWGDPAMLADTDIFDVGELYKVKSGISYSMCILNTIIFEEYSERISDDLYKKMGDMVNAVLNSTDKGNIYKLIVEYKDTFLSFLND